MKRVLLLCFASFTLLASQAQILNEIMSTPANCTSGGGGAEFFEIFGLSATPVSLDCYALVTYFERKVVVDKTQTVIEKGFYVIDLPDYTVTPNSEGKWWYTVGAKQNFCIGANKNVSALESWNTSNVLEVDEYLYNGSGYDKKEGVMVDDLFMDLDNLNTYKHNAMLFSYQGGTTATLVNGIFTATKPFSIFPLVDEFGPGMPPTIPNAINCGTSSFSISFAGLSGPAVEYTEAVDGTGNGYFRVSDGVCGGWKKSARPEDHSPGSGTAGVISTDTYTISQVGQVICPVASGNYKTSIKFNFTSGDPYPIEYYIIKDDGDGVMEPNTFDTYYGPSIVNKEDAPNNTIAIEFPDSDEGDRYFIRARSIAGCFFATQVFFMPPCTILPVSFNAFNAQRNKQSVVLNWQTATEQNNRGFYVQRNTKGVWENIAWVFSAAEGGNSSNLLAYTYKDLNNERGVSQYRIQQVDFDGKASYSVIRSVLGEEQRAKTTVYPNPSADGKVNVVFEDQSAKAVTVSDLSGRVVRQYRNVLNNVQIEGLESGMYSIQVTDLSSAVSTTEKVIIKKR